MECRPICRLLLLLFLLLRILIKDVGVGTEAYIFACVLARAIKLLMHSLQRRYILSCLRSHEAPACSP